MGLPLRSPVAKLSCEAATEENAKRRSFMPRTQVTGRANLPDQLAVNRTTVTSYLRSNLRHILLNTLCSSETESAKVGAGPKEAKCGSRFSSRSGRKWSQSSA